MILVINAVADIMNMRMIVRIRLERRVDFVKVYNNLSSDVMRAIVAAAHRRGLAVIGHVPRRDGRAQALQIALGAGQDMIAHSEELFFTYFYGDTDERVKANLLKTNCSCQVIQSQKSVTLAAGFSPMPDGSQAPQNSSLCVDVQRCCICAWEAAPALPL
jgi:hypothetical protein